MEKLLRNKTAIILFMAPTLILFTAILLVPIATSFYYALCDYDKATRAYSFIGFECLKFHIFSKFCLALTISAKW